MNEKAVRDYIDVTRALQEKYAEIKLGTMRRRSSFEQEFKPLIEPLQRIDSRLEKPSEKIFLPAIENKMLPQLEEKKENVRIYGPLASKYLGYYASKEVKTDGTFGIRMSKNGNLYIGDSVISIENDDIIVQNMNEKFTGTPGLWQLLTLAEPDLQHIFEEDMENYEKIVLDTNAYRHKNDPNTDRVKASHGTKYIRIIRPILVRNNLVARNRRYDTIEEENEGSGLHLKKILTNSPVEYIYWNSLDKLLERLYIIYGEIKSGNTNPNLVNEIINSLQEICEI